MRLTCQEITNLNQATQEFLVGNVAELRLFGSHVNDNRKGGDIYLLLLLSNLKVKQQLEFKKHLLLARMKELIGEQKIDLRIVHSSELETDPFLKLIYPESMLLNNCN